VGKIRFILPTIVLAYGGVAGYSRFMRTSMLDTINSDYIRTARAKGLNARVVWFKHAARNALIPIATFLGPAIVGIVGGAVVTEQIFNWPGLGQLYIESIARRDYPVIMASVVISSILVVVAYIISDILYALFDPRIRF
ncbi:MAG: ABC transporter permease, partial [Chloroflexota bacterium]